MSKSGFKVSRRQALIGAGALVVLAGGGAALVLAPGRLDYARAILHRVVGPFEMANSELETMLDAFDKTFKLATGVKADAYIALARVGMLDKAEAKLPTAQRTGIDAQERRLLTFFMTSTDYLHSDREGGPVTFAGVSEACASPWARFEDV